MIRPFLLVSLFLHAMGGCMEDPAPPEQTSDTGSTTSAPTRLTAFSELRRLNETGSEGPVVGWANFTEVDQQLTIQVTILGGGLNATSHGLHVHSQGSCAGDGVAPGVHAGGHFNPDDASHGAHAGDLGNITTDGESRGTRTIVQSELQAPLTLRANDKYTITGRSLIVHADPDDGQTQPSGGSGARVLCGLIIAT